MACTGVLLAKTDCGNWWVIQSHVALQRLSQIFPAVKTVSPQHIGNAPIETPHYPIGPSDARLGSKSVLNPQFLTQPVQFVRPRGITALLPKSQSVNSLPPSVSSLLILSG